MIDLQATAGSPVPFPHLVVDGAVSAQDANRLCRELEGNFPRNAPVVMGGRQRIVVGTQEYAALTASSPAWKRLLRRMDSTAFAESLLSSLWPHLHAGTPCRFDPSRSWRLDHDRYGASDALERPERNGHRRLGAQHVAMYIGISQAYGGYGREVHADREERVLGGLLYLNGPEDIGGQGGDLILHERPPGAPRSPRLQARLPRRAPPKIRVRPAPGRLVAFLNTNDSYHSVEPLVRTHGRRTFVYFGLTSRSPNVWMRRRGLAKLVTLRAGQTKPSLPAPAVGQR
jgi:hypothetical protein